MRLPDPQIDDIFSKILSRYENCKEAPLKVDLTDAPDYARRANAVVSGIRYRLREHEGVKLKSENDHERSILSVRLIEA